MIDTLYSGSMPLLKCHKIKGSIIFIYLPLYKKHSQYAIVKVIT